MCQDWPERCWRGREGQARQSLECQAERLTLSLRWLVGLNEVLSRIMLSDFSATVLGSGKKQGQEAAEEYERDVGWAEGSCHSMEDLEEAGESE